MKRLGVLVLTSLAACAPIEQSVRTERGPLLRSFTRPMVIEGGLRGQVQERATKQADGSRKRHTAKRAGGCRE